MIHKIHGIGLGLRIPHFNSIFSSWPQVDFFEIISENFMVAGGAPLKNLERVLSHYPVVLHGVSLGIASADPFNWDYLKQLKDLVKRTQTPYFTDHLCWTVSNSISYHDLLPVPYTEKVIDYIAERAKIVQDYIGIPFGLENLSSYVAFKSSEMTEWEFVNQVIEKSGCSYMLDINNIYVSSVNHLFNPKDYVDSIDFSKVLQCHIAGHTRNSNGTILDTHDHPVCDEVWDLYAHAWKRSGGFATLLEWDDRIPTFEETYAEALKAKTFQKLEGVIEC